MNGCLKRIIQVVGVIAALLVVLVVVALTTDIGKAPADVAATVAPLPTIALTPTATAVPWYAGGTLHSATVAEWRAADQRNKLATAADWAAQGFDTVAGLKEKATELLACVEEVAKAVSDTDTVTDLAVGCVVLMKAQ